MKMTSKTTSHKTDVGGVRVNIQSEEQLRAEYQDLISKLTEKGLIDGLEGVIIQEWLKATVKWFVVSQQILNMVQ